MSLTEHCSAITTTDGVDLTAVWSPLSGPQSNLQKLFEQLSLSGATNITKGNLNEGTRSRRTVLARIQVDAHVRRTGNQ